jgi:branched-chain amino acid transport system substrate-binding protein
MTVGTVLRAALVVAACLATSAVARAAEPIKVGFGMALTGSLAAIGKSALLAMKIWEEDVNQRRGLLGRPVKLIYYDDQSNPAAVPALYAKLIDVDKVDIAVSGYATNMVAPAMPIVIERDRLFLGLFALAANSQHHYPKYFSMLPTGPDPAQALCEPFFDVAMSGSPKPKTLAIVAADAGDPHTAAAGAREVAKQHGLQLVYDRLYPPHTTDFTPIVRAVQAAGPEIVFVASDPPDSVGIVRAAGEIGLKTRYFGGGMVGLQVLSIKQQLGSSLNGILDYDWWLPIEKMQFPGATEFLKTYQARARAEGVDPLGWYLPPFAYANMQVLQQAIESTQGLDQEELADWIRGHTFTTVVGDVSYGKDGEWAKPRVLEVQFRNITGAGIDQFTTKTEIVLFPAEFKTGEVQAPYSDVKK